MTRVICFSLNLPVVVLLIVSIVVRAGASPRAPQGYYGDEPYGGHENRGLNSKFYEEVRQLLALGGQQQRDDPSAYPSSDDLLPVASTRSAQATLDRRTPRAVKNWPREPLKIGQVSGVSVNSAQQPVIFHRAERTWDQNTFNFSNFYLQEHLGPISEHTVLTLDPQSGKVVGRWGNDFFYLPHGLTIDRHDNLWVTDVALHQAFKFRPGQSEPSLTFGERFVPGFGLNHLCKPTAIAVASEGEIFIADGYCNARILKYNAAGGLLKVIPNPPEFLSLQVPHALALIESMDRICVADRENMRVTCPRAGLVGTQGGKKDQALTIQQPDMGRVFAVASKGNLVYAVNGPTSPVLQVQGFTIDPQSESVIDHWAPEEGFENPHAIAVAPNGSAIYVAEIGPNRIWKFELVPPKK